MWTCCPDAHIYSSGLCKLITFWNQSCWHSAPPTSSEPSGKVSFPGWHIRACHSSAKWVTLAPYTEGELLLKYLCLFIIVSIATHLRICVILLPIAIPDQVFAQALMHPYFISHNSNTSSGDNAFMVFAPKLWNALPLPIRQAPSLETFKKVLKTHLFVS